MERINSLPSLLISRVFPPQALWEDIEYTWTDITKLCRPATPLRLISWILNSLWEPATFLWSLQVLYYPVTLTSSSLNPFINCFPFLPMLEIILQEAFRWEYPQSSPLFTSKKMMVWLIGLMWRVGGDHFSWPGSVEFIFPRIICNNSHIPLIFYEVLVKRLLTANQQNSCRPKAVEK